MKFDWENFFECCVWLAAICFLCFFVLQVRRCEQHSKEHAAKENVQRIQSLAHCIKETQKIFECKEALK
jgi:hypothetical protein